MSDPLESLERELGLAPTVERLPDGREVCCAEPRSDGQAVELMHLARSQGWCLLPRGFGSRLSWAPLPARCDLLVSTRALCGIVAQDAEAGTLTALAGTPYAELAAAAASSGHELVPDVARPGGSSLGGVLSSGARGRDELQHGPPSAAVIGMRVLLADGRCVQSGTRAGSPPRTGASSTARSVLNRHLIGAHGTLGLIIEATLQLVPAIADRALIEARFGDPHEAFGRALALRELGPALRSLVIDGTPGDRGPVTLTVELAASGRPMARALQRAAEFLADARVLRGGAARAEGERRRDRDLDPRSTFVELDVPPARGLQAWRALSASLEALEQPGQLSAEPALGRIRAVLPETDAADIRRSHAALRSRGFEPRFRDLAPELARELLCEPPGARLMRSLEHALDPRRVFAKDRLLRAETAPTGHQPPPGAAAPLRTGPAGTEPFRTGPIRTGPIRTGLVRRLGVVQPRLPKSP